MPENPVPEGRTSLAQRGSAGKSGTNDSSPGGTTEFSRTHFSHAAQSQEKTRASALRHVGVRLLRIYEMASSFQASWRDEMPENPVPEGRPSLAQRASAGKSERNDSSPAGTTEFSHTHFSP